MILYDKIKCQVSTISMNPRLFHKEEIDSIEKLCQLTNNKYEMMHIVLENIKDKEL
jgi:hypothetical protein